MPRPTSFFFFFFNDTATTEIYTLSLHDALPILRFRVGDAEVGVDAHHLARRTHFRREQYVLAMKTEMRRSEEHTSELQSPCNLVCRLLLEKKKKIVDQMVSVSSITLVVCTYTAT